MEPYHTPFRSAAVDAEEIYNSTSASSRWPICFKQGHRLRLEIVNGDSPVSEVLWTHYYRPDKIGSDTIYHDAAHPSELILPISPNPA